jgi:hypothetical protein
MTEIEKASALVDEIQTKRAQHIAKAEKLAAERDEIALTAFTTGGKSRSRLDEIHATLAKHGSELAALDSALKSAHQRVADLRAGEEAAAAQQRAEELSAHVDELAKVFPYVDKNLHAALTGLIAIERGVAALHQKNVAFPTDVQLRLGIVAVLGTFLQQLPRTWWNEIAAGLRYRAPGEKKTALSYWAQIEPSLRNAIRPRVGGAERTDTEAA